MAASLRDGAVVGLCLMAMVMVGSIGAEAQIISDQLTEDYYDDKCPQLFDIVRAGVQGAVAANPRNGASLIRVHFHDCFVNGCDGSVLLDNITGAVSEQYVPANNNSIRELGTIEAIKVQVEAACPQTVSCADIVALAARDAAIAVGLTYKYRVLFGRLDSFTASFFDANLSLPSPFFNYSELVKNFAKVGLDEVDLVTLSGAHTVGRVHCLLATAFTPMANDGFNPALQVQTNKTCQVPNVNASILVNLDPTTPDFFDNSYYKNLMVGDSILVSDQTLWETPGFNQALVAEFAADPWAFADHFALSMIKMGNISPKLGDEGEIRLNCTVRNSENPLFRSAASLVASQ